MNGQVRRHRWLVAFTLILGAVLIGAAAYNAGVSHGMAQVGPGVAPVGPEAGPAGYPPYPYYWHRPWGFGLFFPFLMIWFILAIVRGSFWWGAPWRRQWYYHGYGPEELPGRFDEWHRHAHEKMQEKP